MVTRLVSHAAAPPNLQAIRIRFADTDVEKGLGHDGFVDGGRLSQKRNMLSPSDLGRAVIRVEVHDTGVGLPQDVLAEDRLFSPYVQTEIGRRQGGKGSGLGLALVKQIVSLSRGRLGVESTLGKGSTFW